MISFDSIFNTIYVPYIFQKFHFLMQVQSWYATMWYTPTWWYVTLCKVNSLFNSKGDVLAFQDNSIAQELRFQAIFSLFWRLLAWIHKLFQAFSVRSAYIPDCHLVLIWDRSLKSMDQSKTAVQRRIAAVNKLPGNELIIHHL